MADAFSEIAHLKEIFFKWITGNKIPNLFKIQQPSVCVHALMARVLRSRLSELFALYRKCAPDAVLNGLNA